VSSDYETLKKQCAKFRAETKTLLEDMDELREQARSAKAFNDHLEYVKLEAKHKILRITREKIDAELRAKDLSYTLDSARDHMSVMAGENNKIRVEVSSLRQLHKTCSCNKQGGERSSTGSFAVKNPFSNRRDLANAQPPCPKEDETTDFEPHRRQRRSQSVSCEMQMSSVSRYQSSQS
jgi:hypothetical protein